MQSGYALPHIHHGVVMLSYLVNERMANLCATHQNGGLSVELDFGIEKRAAVITPHSPALSLLQNQDSAAPVKKWRN
jgi:hypothetical protein